MRTRAALLVSLPLAFATLGILATTTHAANATVEAVAATSWAPETATVNVGETVTWHNATGIEHSVKCVTPPSGAKCWTPGNGRPLPTGSSTSVTFSKPGTYSYVCGIHSNMTGHVKVLGASPPPVVTTPPTKSPTPTHTTSPTPSPKPTTKSPSPTPTPTTKSPTPTPTPTTKSPTPTPTPSLTTTAPVVTDTPTVQPTSTETVISGPAKKASKGVSNGTLVALLIGLAVLLALGGVAGLYFTRAPKAPKARM